MVYGGFWIRFVAYLIDQIIMSVASFIISFVVALVLGIALRAGGTAADSVIVTTQIIGGLIGFVLGWLYYAIMESSARQATFGKQAMGLIVTDQDGYRISFGRATGRYFAKILSGLILGIGFLMIGFSARKQGLHDQIADTLVVKADPGTVRFSETFA
jgi:uncharacterized RDD family membrane protein YckC